MKHLRDAALPFDEGEFVYDTNMDCFGFQKDYLEITDEEGFVFYTDQQVDDPQVDEVNETNNLQADDYQGMSTVDALPGDSKQGNILL